MQRVKAPSTTDGKVEPVGPGHAQAGGVARELLGVHAGREASQRAGGLDDVGQGAEDAQLEQDAHAGRQHGHAEDADDVLVLDHAEDLRLGRHPTDHVLREVQGENHLDGAALLAVAAEVHLREGPRAELPGLVEGDVSKIQQAHWHAALTVRPWHNGPITFTSISKQETHQDSCCPCSRRATARRTGSGPVRRGASGSPPRRTGGGPA